jgi:hypothetical protein
MAKRKKEQSIVETTSGGQPNAAPINNLSNNIFALVNRGMLLDIVVFLLNVFLMRWLSRYFMNIFQQVSNGDRFAEVVMLVFFVGIFLLPPLGAILKRPHVHQRLQLKGKDIDLSDNNNFIGCLGNPIFYFILSVLLYIAISTLVQTVVYGDEKLDNAVQGVISAFSLPVAAVQTFFVYRYFSPLKHPPRTAFFRSPLSELLGDVSIYLNMILFQIVWNVITSTNYSTTRITGIGELFGRILMWSVIALIVYFPPRIFYLAEDAKRPRVWLTMLLANLPVIYRVVIGHSSANW